MHPPYLREKARHLRIEKKLTIDQIAERLALSRTTVYYWVKDLPIPYLTPGRTAVLPRLRKGNLRMQAKYRRLREEAYAEGRAEFSALSQSPTFRDFVSLYIAEGTKRDRNTVCVCNSDAAVLRVCLAWMERFTGNWFDYGIQYHEDQKLDELRSYWADQLDIEPDFIRVQRKSNSSQMRGRNCRSRYGVLTIRCHDTLFGRRSKLGSIVCERSG